MPQASKLGRMRFGILVSSSGRLKQRRPVSNGELASPDGEQPKTLTWSADLSPIFSRCVGRLPHTRPSLLGFRKRKFKQGKGENMKTTSQKHAELKSLGKKGKDLLFQRLKLTDEILRDSDYVDQFGSEVKLIEILEADEWSDFASRPGLTVLIKAYRLHPERATWEEYKFDWAAIVELDREARESTSDRVNWKKRCEELELANSALQAEVRLLKDLLQERLSLAREVKCQ